MSIDNTWLAYAFERRPEPARVDAALRRVAAHYGELYTEPLVRHEHRFDAVGMALWHREDPRLRWPLWARDATLAVAATNAPTGTERVVGAAHGERGALKLGAALRDRPERLRELNPPFVIAVLDERTRSLTIVNDFLATGRLYELRTEEGRVWANRLGALAVFAGRRPEASADGWAMLAAAGWFLGESTPFRGVRKVLHGSVIVAREEREAIEVDATQTNAVAKLVGRRRALRRRSFAAAARQTRELAESIDRLWDTRVVVNFSGGRDSRVTAAGTIAAGLDATYRTMDIQPGEADAVRALVAAAPVPIEHSVTAPEQGEPEDGLDERLRALLSIHDAISNPMSLVRAAKRLPEQGLRTPLVTGHGGELGHGFYYSARSLKKIERGGEAGIVERLEGLGRQTHSAAREEAYAVYAAEVGRTIAQGRERGVQGPSLLDYFYLAQRLAFRAGLGTRNDRYSACATPAFVRASFDLEPIQRVRVALHQAIVDRLVPQWSGMPFFHGEGGAMPEMNRDRIWEKPRHAEEMEAMLSRDDLWGELFDPARVREMWSEVRAGRGRGNYEPVFLRIAWRVGFESHLERLAAAAGAP